MENFLLDLRYAWRQLGRQRAFTAAAVLTLSLGIGATITVFTLVEGVVLSPLPFPEPERLVRIWEVNPRSGDFATSEPTYLDWVEWSRSFAMIAAYRVQWLNLAEEEPLRLPGAAVSADFFSLLGGETLLGRTFRAREDRPESGERPVVLGSGLWRERFGADPEVLGRRLDLQGHPHTVVGVMEEGFEFPLGTRLWVPLRADPHAERGSHWLTTIGRVAPGVSIDRAGAEMSRLAEDLARAHPEQKGWGVRLEPLKSWLVDGMVARRLLALGGAVGLLLLLASINVSHLLIARARARRKELGIRSSLGAGGGRLGRQLLTECSLLAVLGGAGGFLLATWMVPWLLTLAGNLPRAGEVELDGRSLAFTAAVSLLAFLLFGLAPARAVHRPRVDRRLEISGGGSAGSGRGSRTWLVAGQVALATMLLVGAGLLLRSLLNLRIVDPGFDHRQVLTVPLELPWDQFDVEERLTIVRELEAGLAEVPGVLSVGGSASNPLRSWGFSNDVTPEERAQEVGSGSLLQVDWRAVTPGFFRSLSIPLVIGRTFTPDDRREGERVAVISRSLGEILWPGAEAVDRRLFVGGTEGEPYRIVGVVGDLRDRALSSEPRPVLYLPYEKAAMSSMTFFVRHEGEAGRLIPLLGRRVRGLAPSLPIPEIVPMERNLSESLSVPAVQALLFGLFAGFSLFLAAVGIFGLLAFLVTAREREIGIRRVLGAGSRQILQQLFRQGLRPLLLGMGAGLAGALVLSRLLEGQLYGIAASDPWTFGWAAILLAAMVLLAATVPARRALRIEPRELCTGE